MTNSSWTTATSKSHFVVAVAALDSQGFKASRFCSRLQDLDPLVHLALFRIASALLKSPKKSKKGKDYKLNKDGMQSTCSQLIAEENPNTNKQ